MREPRHVEAGPPAKRTPLQAALIRGVKTLTHIFGVELSRYQPDRSPTQLLDAFNSFIEIRNRTHTSHGDEYNRFLDFCRNHLDNSTAQLFQDLFVQFELQVMKGGFFVEFGATDGMELSNTYMLERHYGWTGIVAEPAKCWQAELRRNRSCIVDQRCVWDKSGETLEFNEVADPLLSTVNAISSGDGHALARQNGTRYSVESISLTDLLDEHGAPPRIDYLSIDTEGSEFLILSAFDFRKYNVQVITVEHNYTSNRDPIHSLLSRKGFIRKFEIFSQWDDWYIRA